MARQRWTDKATRADNGRAPVSAYSSVEAGNAGVIMQDCLWGRLLAWATILLLRAMAGAQAASDCDGLTIKVTGLPAAGEAQCEQRKIGGGDGTATNESIRILGASSIFVVSHTYAGLRTYLMRQDIKGLVGRIDAFETASGWGDERDSGEFTVRSFEAKVRGEGGTMPCFGFSRFSGHVPNTGGGYRHHIFGFYCDFLQRPVDAARVDELVASIKYEFE